MSTANDSIETMLSLRKSTTGCCVLKCYDFCWLIQTDSFELACVTKVQSKEYLQVAVHKKVFSCACS